MKRVLILGAGFVIKPMVDYFINMCQYDVTVATRTVSKAQRFFDGYENGTAVPWLIEDIELLDKLVGESDIVVSMIPPDLHIPVAKSCIAHKKNLVTTSYISPEMQELDKEAKENGLIFLNEIGEDPGIDHMTTKKSIDEIGFHGGKILKVISFGAGLPSFNSNNNPMAYKFSWSPKGVMLAAQTAGKYLNCGKVIEVPGEKLFENYWLVDIDELGTFETYPNRDSLKYIEPYGLNAEGLTLYRGLLRFSGHCNNMLGMLELGLLDDKEDKDFSGTTYKQFLATLLGCSENDDLEIALSKKLEVNINADIIKRLKWLGWFGTGQISSLNKSNVDVTVELMLRRMSYQPYEKDMIIIHNEVTADFHGGRENRIITVVLEGIPLGDSAMSRAVSIPASIAAKLILENKITERGVIMPIFPDIYNPVLKELESDHDFILKQKTIRIDDSFVGFGRGQQ
ncbi:saccharopine dehydrogenase C-terminal domain-containing protein [candidate division KSB1 bacterium]